MSKTYTLTSTACKGGLSASWTGGDWNNYYFDNNSGETRRCGQRLSGGAYCATYYMFDAAILASLKSKTITSVKLTITVIDGTGIPGGSSDLYAIREKLNNSVGSGSSSSAWQGGDSVLGYVRRASGSSSTFDITLSNTIPTYGYVLGAYAVGYGQYLVLESSATLTVVTNETDYSYTLAYDANGGSGAPSNQTGSNTGTSPSYTFTIPNTSPTRTGYTFLGWSTSSSATSASYSPGGSITVTSSGTTTLYAVWKKNTYTVSYNANGGSGAPASQEKTYNVNLTLSSAKPTRSGYSFNSWNTKADGTGTSYASGGTYSANSDVTLYAIWTNNSRTVTYNANGGTGGPATQQFISGSSVTLSSVAPSRTGHQFLGWSQSQSAATASYTAGGTYTFNDNVTLYAVWAKQTYTISFNANGGSNAPTEQVKTYGDDLTLTSSQPTRSGYTFLGWARSNTATAADYVSGATYRENGNTTLYAVWSVVVYTHTLTYSANGGTGAPTAQTQTYSVEDQRSFTVTSDQPIKDGYAFLGWSNTAAGTVDYVAGDTITAAADKTIYAVWEKVRFTISYNANGGSNAPAAQTKQKNVPITITDGVPTKQDSVFIGWATNAQATEAEYHGGDSFTTDADTVLYAVWGTQSGMNVYVVQSGALVECDVYTVVSGEPVLCDVYVGGEENGI